MDDRYEKGTSPTVGCKTGIDRISEYRFLPFFVSPHFDLRSPRRISEEWDDAGVGLRVSWDARTVDQEDDLLVVLVVPE